MVAPRAAALATLSLLSLAPRRAEAAWYDEIVDTLQLPAGFSASVYAEVPAARSLSYNPATGTVFVGAYDFSGIQGRDAQLAVYALRDLDGNDDALGPSEALPVTQKIANPNGVSFLNGDLFVAQMDHIDKYADIENDIETLKSPTQVVGTEALPFADGSGLPDTHWHGWRYLTANPATNKLYVTIGSPCNVPGDGEVLDCNGKKTGFLSHLYIKVILLPRQARDKHRESTQKKPVFLGRKDHRAKKPRLF